MYQDLLLLEKKLDETLKRKQLAFSLNNVDINEAIKTKLEKQTRKLRMSLYNTVNNQIPFYHIETDQQSNVDDLPFWSLRIEGKILEDGQLPMPQPVPKFSSFFKKIVVELDKELYPNDYLVEWDSSKSTEDSDGFEIKRPGDQETSAMILFYINYNPPRYKVSEPLFSRFRLHTETRPRILAIIWAYIKDKHLQDPLDRKSICNDDFLKSVFGCDKMTLSSIPERLDHCLSPPDPLEFQFDISLAANSSSFEKCFDITIDLSEYPDQMQPIVLLKDQTEINQLDKDIQLLVNDIRLRSKKMKNFQKFAEDPWKHLDDLSFNQVQDYQILKSQKTKEQIELEGTNDYFQQMLCLRAIQNLLNKKPQV